MDIGAGRGVKVGIFSPEKILLQESMFPIHLYGETFSEFVSDLSATVEAAVKESGRIPLAVGISAPGILSSDGAFKLFQNCPQYNGHNLKTALSSALGIPAEIENDANVGALAEWSVLRMELLYWVFGGGWGAWISRDGKIRYPSHDWDGVDTTLHPTNEPGYSIGLTKWQLKSFFNEVGASFELFELNLEDEELPPTLHTGPMGDPNSLRAELILSGPGRCRLFRSVVGNDDFYTQFLDIHEVKEMTDPSIAGRHISKLSRMRVESAINTDRLYGKILAEAARILLKRAEKDGLDPGAPICLGGKPSYALPYFGPSAQRLMGKMGFMYYLRPSVIDERGSNANMVGALVLAERALMGISSVL